MEQINVAIALQSGEMASHITELIAEHPLLELCGVARSLPDLLRLLARFKPATLLVSPSLLEEMELEKLGREESLTLSSPLSFLLTGPGMSWGEEELARVLRLPLRYAGTIARGLQDEKELYGAIDSKLQLFSGGARQPAGHPAASRGSSRSPSLLVVTGAKGGVGATLISCALAGILARGDRRVLLLDMDRDLSQTLHIKPRDEGKTYLDLLPLAEELSWDLVRVSIHRHAAGFHVLPYGRPADERGEREGALGEHFLRNLLFLFDLVVLDIPRPAGKDLLRLLPHSPLVLLISHPDALCANCARRAAFQMRRSGFAPRHLRLAVNRCGPRQALRPEELAAALEMELCASLPEDPRSGSDFAELGEVPAADSRLGRSLSLAASRLGLEVAEGRLAPAPTRPRFALRRAAESTRGGGQ